MKLGEFRRNILLAGLDQKSGEVSIRGKSILDAMRVFKDEIEPGFLKQFNFTQFVLDPMKQGINMDPAKRNKIMMEKQQKLQNFKKIKKHA